MPPPDRLPLRPRTLAEAGLDGRPAETFKSDARSRVWRVETPQGPRVVKRFEHSPLRQRVALWLGLHPAQRELRRNRRLRAAGIAVVPAVDAGVERDGRGVRVWLAFPWRGRSLVHLLRAGALRDLRDRRRAAETLAALTADLIRGGWLNRDHKSSNLLLDDQGAAWLVDAGAVRRAPLPRRMGVPLPGAGGAGERMLALLHATTPRRLVSRPERLRFLWRVVDQAPSLGDRRSLARRLMRVPILRGHGKRMQPIAAGQRPLR